MNLIGKVEVGISFGLLALSIYIMTMIIYSPVEVEATEENCTIIQEVVEEIKNHGREGSFLDDGRFPKSYEEGNGEKLWCTYHENTRTSTCNVVFEGEVEIMYLADTGSMLPCAGEDDFVIVKITDDVGIGDFVSYPNGNQDYFHQIVNETIDNRWITQGVNNKYVDNTLFTKDGIAKAGIPQNRVEGRALMIIRSFD